MGPESRPHESAPQVGPAGPSEFAPSKSATGDLASEFVDRAHTNPQSLAQLLLAMGKRAAGAVLAVSVCAEARLLARCVAWLQFARRNVVLRAAAELLLAVCKVAAVAILAGSSLLHVSAHAGLCSLDISWL